MGRWKHLFKQNSERSGCNILSDFSVPLLCIPSSRRNEAEEFHGCVLLVHCVISFIARQCKFTPTLETMQPLGNWLCKLNYYFQPRVLHSLEMSFSGFQIFIPILNIATKTSLLFSPTEYSDSELNIILWEHTGFSRKASRREEGSLGMSACINCSICIFFPFYLVCLVCASTVYGTKENSLQH